MRDVLEKLTEEEDRYDPEKDLRSKMIDMFYKEGYSFDGEQKVDSERHLEFKKGDSIVKVII